MVDARAVVDAAACANSPEQSACSASPVSAVRSSGQSGSHGTEQAAAVEVAVAPAIVADNNLHYSW